MIEHLFLVISPIQQHCLQDMATREIWLPTWYASLQDISYNRMPISSNPTYPAALLLARYSCQRGIASDAIWLPVRYACLQDIGCLFAVKLPLRRYWQPVGYDCRRNMATSEIWLPARYTCLEDISYNLMPNSSDLTFTAILTASEIWLPMGTCDILLPTRYGYQRDMCACKILAISGCNF